MTAMVRRTSRPNLIALTIDPATWGPAEPLGREVANAWKAKHHQGSWSSASLGLTAFNKMAVIVRHRSITCWDHVTIAALEELEGQCTKRGQARFIWDVLRSLPGTSTNGRLAAEVAIFVQSNPRVAERRVVPTEALPQALLRDVLRAAMRDVAQCERRIEQAAWDGESPPPLGAFIRRHETIAFYVLLCMEWGQSPDVIRMLSFDSSQPVAVLDWHDGHPRVDVRWFKNRGGRQGVQTFLADKQWRAGSLLRRLRAATSATRSVAPTEWRAHPWICTDVIDPRGVGAVSGLVVARTASRRAVKVSAVFDEGKNKMTFLAWCQHPRKPGLDFSIPTKFTRGESPDPLHYRAIRPAAKWARFTATGKGMLLSELVDDNTIETLAAHYLNSEVAMRDIAEAWQDIPGMAEEVARGLRPTAINNDGAVVSGLELDDDEVAAVTRGERRVGMSSCRDPYDSPLPGESTGRLCKSANRGCYFCPNSVVSPDDIPFMKAFLLLAESAAAAMSPPEWALHWGRTVRWINHVMPQMDSNWEATAIAAPGVLDLGLEASPA
ncbi:hypothetical protein [Rhodococcus koreensis]|uniref:hypothetical protein n=1 Tax=Rhodococcus koreensis TaxID=99653 RepID=UPI00198174D5|nr:hypothetical protein [Rhodococcus koreensis]QSE86135.1 hypothetical protein JWS14_44680 [Rhodococcus koreensis]